MKTQFILAVTISSSVLAMSAFADTTTGTVGVTLTLTNGCLVNSSPSQTGVNFGSLNFGSHPATIDTLTATLTGSGSGGNAFDVQCSANTTYTVALSNSLNSKPATVYGTEGTPGRYLLNPSVSGSGIAYNVYGTSAMATALTNGAAIPIASTSGNTNSYSLWGKIAGVNNNTALSAGTYSDTLNITISY